MHFNWHKRFLTELPIYRELQHFLSTEVSDVAPYLVKMAPEKAGTQHAMDAYKRRQDLLEYFNHSKYILDIHLAALAQPLVFDGAEDQRWQDILMDATLLGDTVDDVFRAFVEAYLTYGFSGVHIDAPAAVAETADEQQQQRQRSYQVVYAAPQIRDWQIILEGGARGQLSRVVLEQPVVQVEGKPHDCILELVSTGAGYIWRKWRAVNSGEFSATSKGGDYTIIAEGVSDVTIPFVIIGRGIQDSAIRTVQQISRVRLNKQSSLDNILYYQGFRRVGIAGVEPQEAFILAENTFATFQNPDAKVLDFGESSAEATQSSIDRLDRVASRVGLKQRHLLADDTRQTQSAESKSKDAESLNEWYDKTLDKFTRKMQAIYDIHAEYEGLTPIADISIERNYRSDDSEAQVIERDYTFQQARELGAIDVQKEVLKQGVQKLRSAKTDELLDYVDNLQAPQQAPQRTAAEIIGLTAPDVNNS